MLWRMIIIQAHEELRPGKMQENAQLFHSVVVYRNAVLKNAGKTLVRAVASKIFKGK